MKKFLQDLEPLQKFVKNSILPGMAERDEHHTTPIALFEELFKLGWWTSFIATDYGGAGLTTPQLCEVVRTISSGSPGMGTSFAANLLALVVIQNFADETLKKKILNDVTSQFSFSSFCYTEPNSGSDVMSVKTTATSTQDGYILNGSKCFITNINHAKHLVVVAKVAGITDPKRLLSIFYLPADTKGVSMGKPLKKMGQRDSNTSEVFFDNVFIPTAHRIGLEGDGLKMAGKTLQRSRIILASASAGLCERAFEITKDHLAKKERYSKPLLEQPTIRCFLAQLHAETKAIWCLTIAAAESWDEGNNNFELSSMAKLLSGQNAVKVAHGTMELFGGNGYSTEYEIERIYRDAKVFETLEGPTFVQQTIIAKDLFPRENNKAAFLSLVEKKNAA